MVNRLIFETAAVYCIGDIHGGFAMLEWYVKSQCITDSLIILCGDVGLGFESIAHNQKVLQSLDKVAKNGNNYFILMRGNHDDPALFNTEESPFMGLERVFVIPDYTVVTVKDGDRSMNILCVGGAVSVDRVDRIKDMERAKVFYRRWHRNVSEEEIEKSIKRCYWKEEPFQYLPDKLQEIKDNSIKIEAVVTHTAPIFCHPVGKNNIDYYLVMDMNLSYELDRERKDVEKLYDRLVEDGHQLKYWCYGHFHMDWKEEINGTLFVLLDRIKNNRIAFQRIF